MDEGQKRIKSNEFQEVVRCLDCKKLFFADSEHELGNWQSTCDKCRKKDEEKEQIKIGRIKKMGKPLLGLNGILGWKLGKEEVVNYDYPFPKEFGDINVSNFEDFIKKIKKENQYKKVTILWHPILYDILLSFVVSVRYANFLGKKKLTYMGINHKEYLKTDKYIVKYD